jgi:hypothetical protein
VSAPPDFIGIGTHLAGGLWWADLLGDHPLVHGPADGDWSQEFFSPFCARPMQDADVAAYHARFPRRGPGVVGEWSPRYLYDAWTLPLLRRAAPDAKLLVLLRDPVERYQSALSYRLAEERRHGKWVSMTDVVHRGRYASQLRALHAFFDPGQVLVLQYEQCLAEPLAQYERTLAFLGVGDEVPRDVSQTRGESMEGDKEPLWPELVLALRTVLDPEVRELAALVPDVDLTLWPHFADLAVAP